MSTPASIVAAQLQALLDLIEKRRKKRCRAITERMNEEKKSLLFAASREARHRLHQAVEEERARTRRELEQARARLQTRHRAQSQMAAVKALREGYPRLERMVASRWLDPVSRNRWIIALIEQAIEALPRARWQVRFAPVRSSDVEGEIREIIARLADEITIDFQSDPVLKAGLQIGADSAWVNGTSGDPNSGLMADRSRVEAALVAEVRRVLEERNP